MPIFLANEDRTYVPARMSSSARLVVLSVERTPDEITAHLGMTPDRWWLAELTADPRIHSVRLWLGHHSDNENPGLSVSAELVNRLARLRTGLEVDVYVLPQLEGDE